MKVKKVKDVEPEERSHSSESEYESEYESETDSNEDKEEKKKEEKDPQATMPDSHWIIDNKDQEEKEEDAQKIKKGTYTHQYPIKKLKEEWK